MNRTEVSAQRRPRFIQETSKKVPRLARSPVDRWDRAPAPTIEKDGRDPLRRLMVAQDTGSAIKGAQRADIFYGTGDAARLRAGSVKDPGRMVVLLPIQMAYALAPGG